MEITKSLSSEYTSVAYVKRISSTIDSKCVSKNSTLLLALEIRPLVDILDSSLTIQDVPVILGLLKSNRQSNNRLIYLKENERLEIDSKQIVVWLSIEDLLLLQSCGLTNDRIALEDTHILKSWPLLYGIDTEIYTVLMYLQSNKESVLNSITPKYESQCLDPK